MNALEMAIALGVMSVLSASTAQFVTQAWQSVGVSTRTVRYLNTLPRLQTTLRKTVGQATRVNIYPSYAVATSTLVGSTQPLATGDSTAAMRIEYSGGPATPLGGNWAAIIYRNGTDLLYRNVNTDTSWVMCRQVSAVGYDLRNDGLLILTVVADGTTYTVWTGVN